jgi:hypothetical protein
MAVFYAGLGVAFDQSAFAVLQHEKIPRRDANGNPLEPRVEFWLRHVEHFERGASYPDILEAVKARVNAEPLRDNYAFWTNLPQAASRLFILANIRTYTIDITRGDTATNNGRFWSVPRSHITSAVQVLLQTKRLRFALGLPDVQSLAQDLTRFQVSDNTDSALALAVAMPAWHAHRRHWRRMGQ